MPSVTAIILGSLLAFSAVPGQPEPEMPSPLPPSPSTASDATTPEALWSRIAAYYRAGAQGERIVIRAVSPSGSERLAVIEARYDAGSTDRPARIRLDLGRITISAGDGVIRVISHQDPVRIVERPYSGALTPATLHDVIPPVPLPQIDWALGAGRGEHHIAALAEVEWTAAAAMDNGWLRLEGHSAEARAVLIAEPTGRVRHLTVYADGGAAGIIELASEAMSVPPPHTWDIDPSGRTIVDSLDLLSPPPPDVPVGGRVPNLGLMSPDMLAWSLGDVLRVASVDPAARERSAAALLVLFEAGDSAAEASAAAGVRAAIEAKRSLERRGLMGGGGRIGISVHPVAVLEVSQFRAPLVRELAERWKDRGHAGFVWTSSGSALLDRFARSATSLLLVVDDQQRLLGAIPLDGRAGEVDALRAEIERVIRPTIDPIALPQEIPAQESPAREPGGG